jgi:hypothetical protein
MMGALVVFWAVLQPAWARARNEPAAQQEIFQAAQFDRASGITNRWMPMRPGTRWIYEGNTIEEDGKVVPHRIEVAVTDLTKMIAGVCATVSYDVDYTDNELVEAELAFYAQDVKGRVWLLGEYPEEYEDG